MLTRLMASRPPSPSGRKKLYAQSSLNRGNRNLNINYLRLLYAPDG